MKNINFISSTDEIKGKTVKTAIHTYDEKLNILFTDGSVMSIKAYNSCDEIELTYGKTYDADALFRLGAITEEQLKIEKYAKDKLSEWREVRDYLTLKAKYGKYVQAELDEIYNR